MITLTIKKRLKENAKCIQCVSQTGMMDQSICNSCGNYIMTAYKCPRCMRISYYMGMNEPDLCGGCGVIFPPMDLIKVSRKARRAYHIDTELL